MKKKQLKIVGLVIVAVVVMTMGLTGCGNVDNPTETPAAQESGAAEGLVWTEY